LENAGKISHEVAKQIADEEYEKFNKLRITDSKTSLSDFDKAIKQIEIKKKK
jgi:hypothetical protein